MGRLPLQRHLLIGQSDRRARAGGAATGAAVRVAAAVHGAPGSTLEYGFDRRLNGCSLNLLSRVDPNPGQGPAGPARYSPARRLRCEIGRASCRERVEVWVEGGE